MKKITIMLVFAVFATMFMVGCGGDDASAEFTKKQQEISKEMESKPLFERDPRSDLLIKEGTPEELMHKYGPLDMTQAEIDKLVASIKWESNPNPSVLGSPKAKKGGTFVYGMTGYPATIRTEGENSSYVFNTILSGLVYESMTGLDSITLKTTPGLANKWSIGEDKRTYFFHVDPEAKWIDGKPVTSYDYVSSWDLLTSEGLKTPFTMDYWNKYERPVALTPSIVMIRAKNVEWRLFMSAGGLTVYPEHIIGRITPEEYMTEYHTKMMPGTGPYVFDEARTNEYITMRRNDNYWAKNKPYMVGTNNFETIRYIFHTDEAILLEKFKAGEMDFTIINMARRWVQEYTADSWDAIKKNHVVRQRVFNQAPTGMSGFAFNMRRKPFDDVRVRKAIAHLFNREKMMDTLFFNEYVFMDSYFPNSPYEN
ncbi:MAG: ABC transporter substrate-binding protein, partial [Candidatus Muiribacteriota bacterium]